MKKIALMLFCALVLFSCEKDFLIPGNEVPEWLKSKIEQDEQMMIDHPSSCLYYGAWLRYRWQDEYYFEYHCSCSSSSPRAFSKKAIRFIFMQTMSIQIITKKNVADN